MKMIERAIYREFQGQINPGRVLILLGARRVGKTHLLKQIASKLPEAQTLFLNGEDHVTHFHIKDFNDKISKGHFCYIREFHHFNNYDYFIPFIKYFN